MKAPVIFIGHGSPMNAIADNTFTRTLSNLRELCPKPRAILCVSAHWMTEGSWITAMSKPKTIHDFYGFPQELFEIQYPAPGDPELAHQIANLITDPKVHLDQEMWGLDHGTWSVVRHIFPNADIPILQLSLYLQQPAEYHLKLGEQLHKLREMGVLIIGSGNVVHNLRLINWQTDAPAFDWATEYDLWIKEKIEQRDFRSLALNYRDTNAAKMSVPTVEHYLPLLYVVGASERSDKLKFHFEEIHNASISMRTFSFT